MEKLMEQGYWEDNDEDSGEEYIKANQYKIDELVSVSTLLWEEK